MSFTVNQARAVSNSTPGSKSYLYEVAPDGIWKGMKLAGWNFNETNTAITFEIVQESTGLFHLETFWSPTFKETADRKVDSEGRIKVMLGQLESFFDAQVPNNNINGTRWGTEAPTFDTFKEFCDFYLQKIDMERVPLFDMLVLYKKGIVYKNEGDKYAKAPKRERGGTPFVSSEYLPRTLSANYNTSEDRGNYQMFLTYKVETLEATITPDVTGMNDLPF